MELGVIELDGTTVTAYIEKPRIDYHVSMGIYVYSPRAFDHLPDGASDFPDLVHRLLDAGERVAAHEFAGEWFDIGTPGDHERAVASGITETLI